MSLSVVIPSYNQRSELTTCLDTLQHVSTDLEIIVVNGPSTDGTSGIIERRDDVDCLIECSSRNLNVARNIGLHEATNDRIALLAPQYRVGEQWATAIIETLDGEVDAVSGPVTPSTESRPDEIGDPGSEADMAINGGNVALTRSALTALDGFDEYLEIGGARDLYRRLTHVRLHLVWHPEMRVTPSQSAGENAGIDPAGWQEQGDPKWGPRYRSRAYLEVKNRGVRPGVIATLGGAAIRDGATAARDVLRGHGRPSAWVGNGVSVLTNTIRGIRDGWSARRADATATRNPHGMSRVDKECIAARTDRRNTTPP